MKKAIMALISGLLAIGEAGSQVPSPPVPAGQVELATKLIQSIRNRKLDDYSDLLAENLEVIEDGKTLARSKSGWVNTQREEFGRKGIIKRIEGAYEATDRILLIEYFNSVGSWGTKVPAHCCWRYDAVAYDIVDQKIVRISRLRGGVPLAQEH